MFKDKLKLIPNLPGCYLMKDKDAHIIYVGKAKNLKRRVSSYFNKIHTGKTKALVDNICDFEYIVTGTEKESLILEINLIKKYNPKYNILLKDDKTYPYIVLSNEVYPSLKIVRSKKRTRIKGKVFGPYPSAQSARETVNLINRLYPLRKCNNMKKDLCLYYHIGECLGYCKYNIDKKEIDKMTSEIVRILNGDYKFVTNKLKEEMDKASLSLNYEKALELKNLISNIESTINKQIIVSSARYNFDVFGFYQMDNYLAISILLVRNGVVLGREKKIFNDFIDPVDTYQRFIVDFYDKYTLPSKIVVNDFDVDFSSLGDLLGVELLIPKRGDVKKILNMANLNSENILKESISSIKENDNKRSAAISYLENILGIKKISRIELFDNSHLFGSYYVGGMVVFRDFLPLKKEYRKYKIEEDVKDDLSAMREVIYRRYYRALLENLEMPDLIIVDGGSLQLNATLEVLNSLNLDIPVIGLKKNDKHQTSKIVLSNLKELDIENRDLFVYLYKMQEEVHRYAISYHRNIKNKGMLTSVLEEVPGIGTARRKELLKRFPSVKKIKEASLAELSEILPEKVAYELLEFLNKEE